MSNKITIPQIDRSKIIGERNRANDTKRDDKIIHTPSITLYDIDYAIYHHLKNNMNLQVEENGKMVPVEVQMANGQKWNQMQRFGYMRDSNDKPMKPLIMITRTNIDNDDMHKYLRIPKEIIAANRIFHYGRFQRGSQNDWMHKTYNTKPLKEFAVTVIPQKILVNYDIYIWTDLTVQMNHIIEQLLGQNEMMWGDAMTFRVKMNGQNFTTSNFVGEDRLVRAETTLEVDGLLQNEFEMKESTLRKAYGIKRVVFNTEIEG